LFRLVTAQVTYTTAVEDIRGHAMVKITMPSPLPNTSPASAVKSGIVISEEKKVIVTTGM